MFCLLFHSRTSNFWIIIIFHHRKPNTNNINNINNKQRVKRTWIIFYVIKNSTNTHLSTVNSWNRPRKFFEGGNKRHTSKILYVRYLYLINLSISVWGGPRGYIIKQIRGIRAGGWTFFRKLITVALHENNDSFFILIVFLAGLFFLFGWGGGVLGEADHF